MCICAPLCYSRLEVNVSRREREYTDVQNNAVFELPLSVQLEWVESIQYRAK